MWELDCEEGWAPKNWCFWTVVLEKTLEIPLACKEIQLVHSKEDRFWVFFGRNDAKAELQYFGHLSQELTHWKGLWCWEGLGAGGEGTTEDEMTGWHHQCDGPEFEWTKGVGDGQGGLVCCNSWSRKESDMTERLVWSDLIWGAIGMNKIPKGEWWSWLNTVSNSVWHMVSALSEWINEMQIYVNEREWISE